MEATSWILAQLLHEPPPVYPQPLIEEEEVTRLITLYEVEGTDLYNGDEDEFSINQSLPKPKLRVCFNEISSTFVKNKTSFLRPSLENDLKGPKLSFEAKLRYTSDPTITLGTQAVLYLLNPEDTISSIVETLELFWKCEVCYQNRYLIYTLSLSSSRK